MHRPTLVRCLSGLAFCFLLALAAVLLRTPTLFGADEPAAKPPLKITPGKVIIPFDRMRRIWGELVSIDPQTRTGVFRNESDDAQMPFNVMPYAQLLHHAANGDLQDFRVGERAIFRMHENDAGKWVYLTYIQDEMNFLNGHKEYYLVDSIDAEKGTITFTQGKPDRSYIRAEGLVLETDKDTRYWKAGQPAKFSDIKVDDKLWAKTHGVGKGKTRMCWEVFLDDESLFKMKAEQEAVHAARMAAEGLPGYIDERTDGSLALTLFQEGQTIAKGIKVGHDVRIATAGVDRKPTMEPVAAKVTAIKQKGSLYEMTLAVTPSESMTPGSLLRVWAK